MRSNFGKKSVLLGFPPLIFMKTENPRSSRLLLHRRWTDRKFRYTRFRYTGLQLQVQKSVSKNLRLIFIFLFSRNLAEKSELKLWPDTISYIVKYKKLLFSGEVATVRWRTWTKYCITAHLPPPCLSPDFFVESWPYSCRSLQGIIPAHDSVLVLITGSGFRVVVAVYSVPFTPDNNQDYTYMEQQKSLHNLLSRVVVYSGLVLYPVNCGTGWTKRKQAQGPRYKPCHVSRTMSRDHGAIHWTPQVRRPSSLLPKPRQAKTKTKTATLNHRKKQPKKPKKQIMKASCALAASAGAFCVMATSEAFVVAPPGKS